MSSSIIIVVLIQFIKFNYIFTNSNKSYLYTRHLKYIKFDDTFIELHKKHVGDQFGIYVYMYNN